VRRAALVRHLSPAPDARLPTANSPLAFSAFTFVVHRRRGVIRRTAHIRTQSNDFERNLRVARALLIAKTIRIADFFRERPIEDD